MGALLDAFLVHYDTIHFGLTPAGIANGVVSTAGRSFPRIRAGYNLYRGVGGVASIDWASPVGAVERSATSISNFPWRGHAASTEYVYAVRSIGGGGVESEAALPMRWAAFDGGGGLLGPRPEGPRSLEVHALAGGKFEIRWRFVGGEAEVDPVEFRLFHDGGTGVVDYDTVIATAAYVSGKVQYAVTTAAFGHDVKRVWGVRAVSDAGVDDGNTATAFAWSDANGPAALDSFGVSCPAEGA